MFKDVSNATSDLPTIEAGTYTVTVLSIEDMEPGIYGERMRWVFSVVDEDGDAVTWEDGTDYEWWQQTGVSLGPRATARKWADALYAKELEADTSGSEIAEGLVGKSARALIDHNENGYPRIVAMTPIKKKKKKEKIADEADPF